ncbi:MAG: hypothetical protein JNL08_10825 [Planctomycetes bacterium]|nr:hypothetical protein [Planctomycetota bacterium]
MNERLRWWALPAAMVVLLRVLTLDCAEATRSARTPVEANGRGDAVVLEAAGRRTPPMPALVPAAEGAFLVALPAAHAGQRGTLTLWRRTASGRDATPWLSLTPRAPADATLKFAGLAAGSYDLEWRLGDAVLVAEAATAPGTAQMQPAAAAPR